MPDRQGEQEEDAAAELWLPALSSRNRPQRSNKPGRPATLSRGQIVEAALEIADRDGAEAVSMRRIARELGVGNMSLYWHVASRDELLALMIDAVEGEYDAAVPSGDWRADLTKTARSIREVLIRHGWMANFIGYRRSVGPNEVEHLESSLAALTHDDVGLGLAAALNVLMAVETYVIGFALRDQQELRIERSGAQRLEGDTQVEVRQYLRNLKAVGRYPNLSLLFESGIALERDERFDYGLRCLLDGIERDLERRFAAT